MKRRLSILLLLLMSILLSPISRIVSMEIPEDSLFIVGAERGLPSPSEDWLQHQFIQVYHSQKQKIDTSLQEPIYVDIRRPDSSTATVRGSAGGNFIFIFSPGHLSRERILGVFAHELGHQMQRNWMGRLSISPMLNEGFATWLAGKYWLRWHHLRSFDSAIRTYIKQDQYIPLETPVPNGVIQDVARRDIMYNEWAAFEEYLLQQYGMPKFKDLCHLLTPHRKEDLKQFDLCFKEIYGTSLPGMEKAWLATL